MIIFSAWSSQTNIIKNKSEKEGYKLFLMNDSITSYILNFTPVGRTVGKDKNLTDRIYDKVGGKIIAMIKFLVQPLVDNMEEFSDKRKYFVIEMENYFILPKLMAMLQEFMRGVVGTVNLCLGWRSKSFKEIDDTQINFNKLFCSVDSFGTLLLKWMENGLVFLVTTFHNVMGVKNFLGQDQE